MAALGAQTVASSYEQLLHTDTDGGGNGNTLVTIKDGDNGTTFGLKLSTNKVEVIPSAADDANAFEVSKNDGTAVFTVDSSSPAVSITGNTTMTTADNTVTLTLTSTDADDNVGPKLHLYRNSGSPAANDFLGEVEFVGRNNNSQDVAYASINGFINDTTDGQEDGRIDIRSMLAGTEVSRIKVDINEVVFNDDSKDVDFRVESDDSANMLFVDGGNNKVLVEANNTDSVTNAATMIAASALEINGNASEGSDILRIGAMADASGGYFLEASNSAADASYNLLLNPINGGNVGVGTTNPLSTMHIAGNLEINSESTSSATADIDKIIFKKQHTSAGSGFYTLGEIRSFTVGGFQGGLDFYTGKNAGGGSYASTFAMRIHDNQKVGIGTTFGENIASSGDGNLTVRSSDQSNHYNMVNVWQHSNSTVNIEQRIGWAFGDDGGAENAFGFAGYVGVGKQGDWVTDANRDAYMSFAVAENNSVSERMRITSGGNTLFGCTSFPSASVSGFGITGTNSGNASSSGSSTSAWNHLLFYNGNGLVGYISTSGSTTTYSTSSDYRLKENQVPISDGLTRLNQLKPYRFNFIADADTTVDGFFAHEVAEIVPEAVTGEKDAVDDDGNILSQGIDQSKLVPLLVKAVQELSAKVEALENA